MILYKKGNSLLALILLLPFFAISQTTSSKVSANSAATDINQWSADFLIDILEKRDYRLHQKKLQDLNSDELHTLLNTDQKKLAFWINLYNAYIILSLRSHPEFYEPEVRSNFFKKRLIKVAGMELSFAEVEHGLVRKSQWEYGLGYFRTWFPAKFERRNRVKNRDFRVHFALNCGAKDCPPVSVYFPQTLDNQFEEQTRTYLTKTTQYMENENRVQITSLFSWFRGDFGGKSGTREILRSYNLIPPKKRPSLSYSNYDWTLDLNNYSLPK